MTKLLIVVAALFGICKSTFAFDHAAYPPESIDQIIEQGRSIDTERKTGFKVMTPPKKLSFEGRLAVLPYSCKTDFLLRVMRIQGFNPEQVPPINTCLRIRSPNGEVLVAYIQDSVAEFIGKEAKVGDSLRFYSSYLYFSQTDQLPYFLVSDFQALQSQSHWDGESRVPEEFARGVIERLRENFWGKMKLPNGDIAEPASESERKGIPIPERLAHSLVTAGALSAKAEECALKTDAFELLVLRAAWKTHPGLNQVTFSGALLSLAKATVKRQPSALACSASEREGFASLLGIK